MFEISSVCIDMICSALCTHLQPLAACLAMSLDFYYEREEKFFNALFFFSFYLRYTVNVANRKYSFKTIPGGLYLAINFIAAIFVTADLKTAFHIMQRAYMRYEILMACQLFECGDNGKF
jgi:hypothetical protein